MPWEVDALEGVFGMMDERLQFVARRLADESIVGFAADTNRRRRLSWPFQ